MASLIVAPADVEDRMVLPELPLEEFIFPDLDELTKTPTSPRTD
jgi:hypothetical protein